MNASSHGPVLWPSLHLLISADWLRFPVTLKSGHLGLNSDSGKSERQHPAGPLALSDTTYLEALPFPPVLWRYNWGIALCKFKAHSIMIWSMSVLRNDYHSKLTSIASPGYKFYLVMRAFKIWFLYNSQIYDTVLLSLVTMLYVTSLEFIHLITWILYLPSSSIPPPASGNHQSDLLLWACVLDSTYKWDPAVLAFLGWTDST